MGLRVWNRPAYLMRLNPEIYQQEQERINRRCLKRPCNWPSKPFISEFSSWFHTLPSAGERGDGDRRIFAIRPLPNWVSSFSRFQHLTCRSNRNWTIWSTGQNIGYEADHSQGFARRSGFASADAPDEPGKRSWKAMMIDRPRRQIISSSPSSNGNGSDHGNGD